MTKNMNIIMGWRGRAKLGQAWPGLRVAWPRLAWPWPGQACQSLGPAQTRMFLEFDLLGPVPNVGNSRRVRPGMARPFLSSFDRSANQ